MCGAGIFPVSEPESVAAGTASPEEDEGQDEEANHHDHFGPGEPKFGFTIKADWHEVEADYDDEHDGHPDGYVDVVGPVVDNEPCGCDLVWDENAECIPVKVAKSETKRAGDVAVAIVGHCAWKVLVCVCWNRSL